VWVDVIAKFRFEGHFEGHGGHHESKLGFCTIGWKSFSFE